MKTFRLIAILTCYAGIAAGWQTKVSPPQLRFAVIMTRHGVRAPTSEKEQLNQYSSEPWPDFGVPPANLTSHGRTLMKIMGEYYRQYFSSKKLIDTLNCRNANRSYFWADIDQRTLETARALAEGILPNCKVEIHSNPEGKADALFDPVDAGVVRIDGDLAVAAVTGRVGPKLDVLVDANRPAFNTLNRILNGSGKTSNSIMDRPVALTANESGVNMTGPLRTASTLSENLLLEYANGMTGTELGWGRLKSTDLLEIITLHTAYADLMRRTPYLARVRGSNLMSFILQSIEQAATGKPAKLRASPAATSLLVITGHDTNLSNLSSMLGVSWLLPGYQRDDVPPGAALIISLWQEADSHLSVRLQFVSQTLDQMHDATRLSLERPPAVADIFMPACSTSRQGYPCNWSSFQRAAQSAIDPASVR